VLTLSELLPLSLSLIPAAWLSKTGMVLLFLFGLSLVIFVHELGHFLVAKRCDVRVEKFALGFGREIFGFTRGETRYSLNLLPLGGYVKMLGQEDFEVDKAGELQVKDDPRSYTHKPVGQRMMIVSAGVIMNTAFAAIFFMIAFMIGMEVMPPKVGTVLPDSPAFRAGLRTGDELVTINGRRMTEWADVMMSVILADAGEPLKIDVRRGDALIPITVEPEYNELERVQQIGIGVPQNLTVAYPGWSGGPQDSQLRVDDVIVALDGKPVRDVNEVFMAICAKAGEPVTLTVERKQPDGSTRRVTVHRRARLLLMPPGNPHFLGAVPRVRLGEVREGTPAEWAGLQEGDVIIEWDGIRNPTWQEISRTIKQSEGVDLRVRVRRAGKDLPEVLLVRPQKPFTWSGQVKPSVGITYRGEIDEENLILADVLPETPMARAGLSRGARIVTINDTPVRDWLQMIAICKQNQGKTVRITYMQDGQRRSGELKVPGSLAAVLGLTPYPHGAILSINGQRTVRVEGPGGRVEYLSVANWRGVKAALEQNVGREVEIEYQVGDTLKRRTILVTEDLTDPWYLRLLFVESFVAYAERTTMQTLNPVRAMWWGIKRTEYFIINIYVTLKHMLFSQQIGVETLKGPVGIVKIGAQMAEAGIVQLIYFLGFLSANFAVINFLPLPIVDGGHFVFLLIEKIKGKPISLRVQMVTQVIGLAIIFGAFIFLTIQDIILWNK